MSRDEQYGNCKLVVGGGELTRNVNKKMKPLVNRRQSHKSIDVCEKCCRRECFLNKHVEYFVISLLSLLNNS